MNRIRLLPEHVANQIAAGEVVERPASVVKELVENALDAQATRITVDIQAGGRSLIRVTDDGLGMSRDDALLCFERHATSKIQRAEDLGAIATMGFRGEALPSIASVSRLTLTTRERESVAGEVTQVIINGGKLLDVKAASGPAGSSVEVRQLFFNLPARRKFMRSEETERAHIHHYLILAALAYPEVGFTFTHDQRVVWQLPPIATDGGPASRLAALLERLRALHGGELKLLPVEFSAEMHPPEPMEEGGGFDAALSAEGGAPRLRVWGVIGAPGVSRGTREDQHLFVNRRPVENRGLNFALIEGYHTVLMKGRYPVCCLFLELGPDEVDVNIHPSKREVKFHAEREVRAHVAAAVRQTLLAFHGGAAKTPARQEPGGAGALVLRAENQAAPAAVPIDLPNLLSPPKASPVPPLPPPAGADSGTVPETAAPVRRSELTPPLLAAAEPMPAAEPVPAAEPAPPARPSPGVATIQYPKPARQASPPPTPTPPTPPSPPAPVPKPSGTAAVPLLDVPMRLVGVVGRLYVVLESDRGMVLLDQHAAHERVLFEQMLSRLEHGQAPSQRLLLPETVELSPRDAQFLREQLAVLSRLGVGLSEFGERTFLLDGLPPFVRVSDARRFVLELVDELKAAGQAVNTLRLGEQVIAKTVCRHAVKANDPPAGERTRQPG